MRSIRLSFIFFFILFSLSLVHPFCFAGLIFPLAVELRLKFHDGVFTVFKIDDGLPSGFLLRVTLPVHQVVSDVVEASPL
jgi:hypothetical protein